MFFSCLWCITLILWLGLLYMADSAGCFCTSHWSLYVQHERNVSPLRSSADSLRWVHISEAKQCLTMSKNWAVASSVTPHTELLIKLMLWWKKCATRNPICHNLHILSEKLGHPLRQTLFLLSPQISISTFSLTLALLHSSLSAL